MGVWNYTYYPTGELWTQTDAKSQTVTFTYDTLGRPLTRTEAEGVSTFVYGTSASQFNIGKLQSISSPSGAYVETYSYDNKGRPASTTVSLSGGASYIVDNSYSALTGMLETVTYPQSTSAVAGSRFKVKYEYEYGALRRVRDFNTPATIYWEQVATNAAGQTVDESFGNGLHSYSTYDAITGLLGVRTTGATAQVQNLAYQWDKIGHLTQRKDLNLTLGADQYIAEDFYYDDLYRLKCSTLNVARQANCSALTAPQKNLDMSYDATGNITAKSGIGSYTYPSSGSTSVRPHAVGAAGSTSYGYDNNGNMITRGSSAITWYSYNLPKKINNGANSAEFFYGPTRARYKQVAISNGTPMPAGTETTIYIGGIYEQVTKPSGVIEHKHYVIAGAEAIAIRTLRSNNADDTRYLHKDHLGSVDTITSETGSVLQRLSYDAFGKRRSATTWSGGLATADWTSIAAITHSGFTAHEQLDNVDLIHMNGRVYDPNIGRFISADPYIQEPSMSQSFNRYSYVMNDPLSMTDPSGFSWLSKQFKKARKHLKAVLKFHLKPTPRNFFETIRQLPNQDKIDRYIMTHEWAYKVGYAAAVVSSWWIGGYGGAVYQAYYSYLATGSATEGMKVGLIAAAQQYASNYFTTGSGFDMPATSSGPVIVSFDSGAGAAAGPNFFNMFLDQVRMAPSSPGPYAMDRVGNGTPTDVDNDVKFNRTLIGYNAISIVTAGDHTTMTVNLRYGANNASDHAEYLKKDLAAFANKSFKKGKQTITLQINLIAGDGTALPYYQIRRCGAREGCDFAGEARRGGTLITFHKPHAGTGTHEVFHTLGLGHQPEGSGSIMSYDAVRRVRFEDVKRLVDAYRPLVSR